MVDNRFYDLVAHLWRGGQYSYYWIPDGDGGKITFWFESHDPREVSDMWRNVNVYFGIHPSGIQKTITQRATIEDIQCINCLFAEFDLAPGQDRQHLLDSILSLDTQPSVIVFSGGGYHCYWLLAQTYYIDSPDARQRIIDIQYAWDEHVTGDNHVKDLARVLRIPGTYNRKPEFAPNYPQSQIIKFELDTQYELSDLTKEIESTIDALINKRTAVASVDVVPVDMDDNTILDKMRQKDSAAAALWDGDMSAYADDHSNADLALCSKLAFWFGRDPVRIDRVFRGSALFRPKWLRDDYRNRTIDKAIQSCTNTYKAPNNGPVPGNPAGVVGNIPSFGTNGHTPTNGAVPPPPPTGQAPQSPPLQLAAAINLTDTGNARRLIKLYGDGMRYVSEWGKWYIWNGKYWAEDKTFYIEYLAKQTVASIYKEAALEPDPDKRRTIAKWAMISEGQSRIDAMVRSAQSEPGVTISHDQLDKGAWFLNVRNGIIDLRTGKLHSHEKDALLTRYIDVDYIPGADCPTWKKFIGRIMADDLDTIGFIQRSVGYTLTGNVSEKCLFFMHGASGDNGKSTFVEVLLYLLGEYGHKAPIEMLMARYGNPGIPNDIAQLPGRRFVVTSETEQGRKLNENMVKDLTGMDTISARFMRQEYFSFQPTHKLWIYGNYKPTIKGRDPAIWNRIRLIPFLVQIPKAEQDKGLFAKLIAELSGILAWAVAGCLEWQKIGLAEPASVSQATKAYRTEMDILTPWIDSNCVTSAGKWDTFKNLYSDYCRWCEDHGIPFIMSGPEFGNALTDSGFVADKGSGNKAIRRGIVTATQDAVNAASSINP
jgi:P4 family phage/plasmid primase-like protien